MKPSRETTWKERATWGECPVCKAQDGEWCVADVGIQFGMSMNGNRMKTGDGAHLVRLQNAPLAVRLVPA